MHGVLQGLDRIYTKLVKFDLVSSRKYKSTSQIVFCYCLKVCWRLANDGMRHMIAQKDERH